MRKIKGIILVAVMALVLTACNTVAEVSSDAPEEIVNVNNSEENSAENTSEDELQSGEQEAVSEVSETDEGEEESTEALSEEVSEEASEEISEEESIEDEPDYTVEPRDEVLYVKKAVNVRKGPSTDYEKIGALSKGTEVQITGIADTGWYQIQYNNETAYVSASYLLDETSYQAMIAEEEAAALAAQQAATEQAQAQPEQEQQGAADTGDYRAQVVALMNQERAAAGIGGITQSATLDALAQIRAQEIVQNFSHTRPNGASCFTVFEENGVTYLVAGENIAAGYSTPEEVMNGWMNSEGHRANILNSSFGQVGIGYYTDPNSGYGTYWVQIFTN